MGGERTEEDLFDGAPKRASTASMEEPRCGVSTPEGLMATWPSMASVSAITGAEIPSTRAAEAIFNVRASMAFSYGRRLDRGGNIGPAMSKTAAVATRRL